MDAKPALAVLLLMVTCCAAAGPTPCCFNEQFTVKDMVVEGYAPNKGNPGAYYLVLDTAVDFTNMRWGIEETIQTQKGVTVLTKIIQDYKKKIQWTIIGKKCTKSELTNKLRKCIEGKTTFTGDRVIGDKQLKVSDWVFNVYMNGERVGNGSISFTNTCVPVDEILLFRTSKGGLLQGHQYLNYTRGIPDPAKWFTVPSICSKAQDLDVEQKEDEQTEDMIPAHAMPLAFLIDGDRGGRSSRRLDGLDGK